MPFYCDTTLDKERTVLMEITNVLLNDLGADPKVYSESERRLMGDFADRIIAGELSALLDECTLPEKELSALKENYGKNRDKLLGNMKKIAALAEKAASLYAGKSTIFSASLSDTERDRIVVEGVEIVRALGALRLDTLDTISYIFEGMTRLYELQNTYNLTLARLGMINIAARAAETAGASYDDDAIMTPILDAYEKLTDFTAFINDLKDKAVIYQKSAEIKLGLAFDNLAIHMDFINDGKNMNINAIMNDAATIKHIVEDVLHTHI